MRKNADCRRATNNTSEQRLWKNLNNFLYGKFLATSREYVKAKLTWTKKSFQNEVTRHTFAHFYEFSKTVGLCVHNPTSFYAKNPIYLGASCLFVSKTIFLRFIYMTLKKCLLPFRLGVFPKYCDTDGLIFSVKDIDDPRNNLNSDGSRPPLPLWIIDEKQHELRLDSARVAVETNYGQGEMVPPFQTIDGDPTHFRQRIYSGFRTMFSKLDVSNLSDENPIFTCGTTNDQRVSLLANKNQNKKRMGCFSFDYGDIILTDLAVLTAKAYCVRGHDLHDGVTVTRKKLKGCRKISLEDLYYEHFIKLILGKSKYNLIYKQQEQFRIINHQVYLCNYLKIVGSALCKKRYYLANMETSLAFGHYILPEVRSSWACLNDIVHAISTNTPYPY